MQDEQRIARLCPRLFFWQPVRLSGKVCFLTFCVAAAPMCFCLDQGWARAVTRPRHRLAGDSMDRQRVGAIHNVPRIP